MMPGYGSLYGSCDLFFGFVLAITFVLFFVFWDLVFGSFFSNLLV